MSALERVPIFAQAMEIVDHVTDHVEKYGGDLEDLVSGFRTGIYADFTLAERTLVIAALAQEDAAPRAAAACYVLGKGGVSDLKAFCDVVDLSGESRDYLLEVLHWNEVVCGGRKDISHLIHPVDDIEGLLASRPWWCVEALDALVGMGPEAPGRLWRHFLTGTDSDVKDDECLGNIERGIQTYVDRDAHYYHPYPLVLRVEGYFKSGSPWLEELLTKGSASALWLVSDALLENEYDLALAEEILLSDDAFQSVADLISRQPESARREAMLTVARWARERLLAILARTEEGGRFGLLGRTAATAGGGR